MKPNLAPGKNDHEMAVGAVTLPDLLRLLPQVNATPVTTLRVVAAGKR